MAEVATAPKALRVGRAVLYHCDWRDVPMQAGAEDRIHLIADPPYEPSTHSVGAVRNRDGKAGHEPIRYAAISDRERRDLARQAVGLGCRWALLFCQLEGAVAWRAALEGSAGARWKMAMPWIKPNAAPKFNAQGPAIGYELMALAWCRGGHARWQARGKRGVYTVPIEMRGRVHPQQKPLALMRQLIDDFTAPGDTVWDPYMGSGTTGVAALQAGRRFVGCEKDPEYFAATVARIGAAE